MIIGQESLQCNLDNKYDIVAGAVADDDMAMLFRQYQNELIDFETLVKRMIFKKSQLSIFISYRTCNQFIKKGWNHLWINKNN